MRGGTTDWARLGEVDHVINRSTAPDLIYETSNGILLSKEENRLKKTACPLAPEFQMFSVEGPEDRAKTAAVHLARQARQSHQTDSRLICLSGEWASDERTETDSTEAHEWLADA